MTKKLVIAGSVNSVVEQILAFREKVGDFGALLYPWRDLRGVLAARES